MAKFIRKQPAFLTLGGMVDEAVADDHARKAVTWAFLHIAKFAPYLEIRPCRHGWDIWWAATETEPAVMHDTARGLDWCKLAAFARTIPASF